MNTSWENIGKELSTIIDTTHLEVLFAAGKPGIEALLYPRKQFQHFLVHGTQDLAFLLYADELNKKRAIALDSTISLLPDLLFS